MLEWRTDTMIYCKTEKKKRDFKEKESEAQVWSYRWLVSWVKSILMLLVVSNLTSGKTGYLICIHHRSFSSIRWRKSLWFNHIHSFCEWYNQEGTQVVYVLVPCWHVNALECAYFHQHTFSFIPLLYVPHKLVSNKIETNHFF